MKRIKNVLIYLMLILLIFAPSATAYTPTLQTNLPKLDPPFFSKHEVLKAIPIYRVTVGKTGIHNYTSNENEYQYLMSLSPNFNDDGILGYVSPVRLPDTTPLYLMTKSYEHYIAPNDSVRNDVIGKYAYSYNGTLGYGVPLENSSYGDADVFCWYRGNGSKSYWNADHYYNINASYISSHTYEGPVFRCWSKAATLQEINLHSPNGGETLTAGNIVDIKWSTLVPGGYIHLYYSTDGGSTWGTIQEGLTNNGSYQWKVPNDAATKTVVEARWDYDGASCMDQSDKYFTIKGNLNLPALELNVKLDISKLLPPAAPTSLTTGSYIMKKKPTLYWKDNAKNETGFVIERKKAGGSFAKIAEVAADSTRYSDDSAQSGIVYVYRVKAERDGFFSKYSNEAEGSVFNFPDIFLELPDSTTSTSDGGITDTSAQTSGKVSMSFTLDKNTYTVNGVTKTMDVSPVSLGGRTMLPIRFAADPIGAETVWNGTDRKVTIKLDKTIIELWIGSNSAMINGVSTPIDSENPDVKPIIINDRTMLPMRFVTESLGCSVEWVPASRQIHVSYPN